MIYDGITLVEGSQVINLTVATARDFPALPSRGELVYITIGLVGLFVYDGTDWQQIGESKDMIAHIGDMTLHLTTAQNAWIDSIAVTAVEINRLAGISSPVQTQLDTEATARLNHTADMSLHLTAGQNTLLDAVTISAAEINQLSGVTSPIQTQISTEITDRINADATKVSMTGSSMTGNLVILAGAKVTLADTPITGTDATNKNYVDAKIAGLTWKNATKAATTVDIVLSGTQTVDGIAIAAGDRVLVKNQAIASQNGIYVAAAAAWARSPDMDQTVEFNSAAVFAEFGVTQANTGWTQVNTVVTVDADAVSFAQFNGAAGITAGVGLIKSGNTLAVALGAGIAQLPTNEVGIDVAPGGGLMNTVDGSTSSTLTNAQLSLTKVGIAGTFKSVTTDVYGRITAGTNPTTLAGYGIIDAAAIDQITYIGTTAIAGNRASGAQTLTGISIDGSSASCTGNSATATTATYLNGTQQTSVFTASASACSMIAGDSASKGGVVIRSNGGTVGDTNLAGMTFWHDAYALKMGVRNDGVFGIGSWSRGAWSWYSDASGNMVAAGNVTAYSDPRLKDNIRKIASPFEIISKLDGVRFNWNSKSKLVESKWGKEDIGILADQVKAVLPEIVTPAIKDEENNETYDTVDYSKLVAVLIEAVKELKAEIDVLKSK